MVAGIVITLVLILVSAAAFVCVLDGLLTYVMVRRGVVEVNPVLRWLISRLGLLWAVVVSRLLMAPLLVIAIWLDNFFLAAFALAAPTIAVLHFFRSYTMDGSTRNR